MTATLRQTVSTVASSMVEGASMAAALIGGAVGAYISYQLAPASWTGDVRILAAGAAAVVGAVAVDGLAELVLTPLRRLTRKTGPAARTTRPSAPAPADTLGEALVQVAVATEDDAAERAAIAAYSVDMSDAFLRDETRWRGYEDGEATFYLAPGVMLHHRCAQGQYGPRHEFTLLSSDGDEVPVTGIDQVRHQLAARAAGFPVSVPADGTTEALHTA
ncbi:hypothetical protein ACFRR7_34835 [Streptomyces sp. NPDC056909]|uniref:hypothetical protein n=1 Tax=Streptomyces sp. NPDC056909 TaxID=3345963 RepID=UPI0036A5DDAE